MIVPRPYQTEALDALASALRQGMQRPSIVWPTGYGKTVLFAYWIKQLREGRPKHRALIIAHRDELIRQAAEKWSAIAPDVPVGRVKAEWDEKDCPVTVASIQTLNYTNRFANLMRAGFFDAVVIDEMHHSESESYQRLMSRLGCFEPGGPLCLGVTATPQRGDKKGLAKTWQGIVHHKSILDGINEGYLANLKAIRVKVDCDFTQLRTTHGEIRDDDSEKMMLAGKAPAHIARAIKEYAGTRPTLVFTPTVKVSQEVQIECRHLGLTCSHLDGTTHDTERQAILKRFHAGETQVLTNCGVLTEGYDEERIACVVMARPTKSTPFYIQCVGRGTRLHPEKDDCLIIDIVGVTHRHDLMTADVLLTSDATKEDLFEQEMLAPEPGRKPEQLPLFDGKMTAEPVDLFASRPFNWLKVQSGYVLSLAEFGLVLLKESREGWDVHRLEDGFIAKVYKGQTLGYAQGQAEDYVRRHKLDALARRDAQWRSKPMTAGQHRMFEKLAIPWHDEWNCGLASDAISRTLAVRQIRNAQQAP